MKLVEGISPEYFPSIKDIFADLFIFEDLASAHTYLRGGAFNILGFSTLPIRWTRFFIARLSIGYILVNLVA
jgi:hypothetical protein